MFFQSSLFCSREFQIYKLVNIFNMSNIYKEDVVTLLWDIENFDDVYPLKLESAVFLSNSLDCTKWKIGLDHVLGDNDDDDEYISLVLTRCPSSQKEVDRVVLDCELSLTEDDGTSLVSKQVTKHGFKINHSWSPCRTFVSGKVFTDRRDEFIPDSILHVRCRMWRSFNETTQSELLNSYSKIERSHYVWKIEKFSHLKANEVKEMQVKKTIAEIPITLCYKCYTDGTTDAAIFEIASDKSVNINIWCEIMALNCTGNEFDSYGHEFNLAKENPCQFPSFIALSKLLENKKLYLPMDVLTLRIDCFFWNKAISDANVYPLPIKNMQLCENVLYAEINNTLGKFAQDMRCMYDEGLLSDFLLCSENRTFPVHKNILSARSPVFKAMFTTPLKEKDGKVLDIPDIDADTLHRMLLFVYSNEIKDLACEDAINLYFAADKYNIEDLKSITCSILKSKLSVSNACEILVHADIHEDQDLKSSAMEFIAGHDDQIIETEDWKKFQKEHMPLAMEIVTVLYTKMKKLLK